MSTNTNNPIAKAVKLALLAGAAAAIAAPAAFAAEDESEVERIEVTGSRIKRTDVEGAQPVIQISREDIEKTGLNSIGDLLQKLPAAGSALNRTFNNGGDGSTRIDLRNLGASRVLVLVNGRRWVKSGDSGTNGSGNSVDLNSIPVSVIERIEVLKDGASAVYGSDAIAGVVNVITRQNFDGMRVSAHRGISAENDAEEQAYNTTIGASSEKGNVLFDVGYVKQEPVWASDRKISSVPSFGTGNTRGSSGTPQGRFIFTSNAGVGVSGTTVPRTPGGLTLGAVNAGRGTANADCTAGAPGIGYVAFADRCRYNFQPDNYILTPSERYSAYVQGRYELADNMTFTSDVLFNRRISSQTLAAQPLFFGTAFGSRAGVDIIDIGANAPGNTFGDIDGENITLIGRRMNEAGLRNFNQQEDTWRWSGGLQGNFDALGRTWDWDVNAIYSKADNREIGFGELNMKRVARALSNDCASDPTCVGLNLFGGKGSITQEMVDYITFTRQTASEDEMTDYTANITGELFELPAGPVGMAIGLEKRTVSAQNVPDSLVVSGESSGNQQNVTSGEYSTEEQYVEFNVPLLSDLPGAQSLELSLASRWADYDSFGSTGAIKKAGLRWKPIDDLLVRGTWAEGFRAPGVGELFGGGGDSFPDLTDPCDGGALANPDKPGCANVPASYTQINTQIRITTASNPFLQPEESESYTFGLVYEPSFVEGLSVNVDWYKVEIENAISTLSAQQILDDCAKAPGLPFCVLLTRNAGGNVVDLIRPSINIGGTNVEGVDFAMSYNLPEFDFGRIKLMWDGAYVKKYEDISVDLVTGAESITNRPGKNFGDSAFPRWKSSFDITWSYGDWEANWHTRYIHRQMEDCFDGVGGINGANTFANLGFCSDPIGNDGNAADDRDARNKIPSTTYHDLQVSYNLGEYQTRLTVGAQNVFDKDPPVSRTAFAGSFDASTYDPVGIFYYARVTKDF